MGCSTAYSKWFCKEAASERTGNVIVACGVATNLSEAVARKQARENAYDEFDSICARSTDCINKATVINPLRNDCEKNNGKYKCYRGFKFLITDEAMGKFNEKQISLIEDQIAKEKKEIERKKEIYRKQKELEKLKEINSNREYEDEVDDQAEEDPTSIFDSLLKNEGVLRHAIVLGLMFGNGFQIPDYTDGKNMFGIKISYAYAPYLFGSMHPSFEIGYDSYSSTSTDDYGDYNSSGIRFNDFSMDQFYYAIGFYHNSGTFLKPFIGNGKYTADYEGDNSTSYVTGSYEHPIKNRGVTYGIIKERNNFVLSFELTYLKNKFSDVIIGGCSWIL